MSPILGIYASQMSGHLWPASSYESIATTTVGAGGSSTITFSSIPSTYTHLQIRAIARTGSNPQVNVRFNSDTASNYTEHDLIGNGASISSYGAGNITWIPMGVASNLANGVSAYIIDILDYANTNKFKTARCLSGYDKNGSGEIGLYSGLWRSTSAISTITIVANVSTYDQYSSFALYGIKGVA